MINSMSILNYLYYFLNRKDGMRLPSMSERRWCLTCLTNRTDSGSPGSWPGFNSSPHPPPENKDPKLVNYFAAEKELVMNVF